MVVSECQLAVVGIARWRWAKLPTLMRSNIGGRCTTLSHVCIRTAIVRMEGTHWRVSGRAIDISLKIIHLKYICMSNWFI